MSKVHEIVVGVVLACASATVAVGQDSIANRHQVLSPLLRATLSQIPHHFIENQGVYPNEVRYYVQGRDKSVFFTRDGITFLLRGEDRSWAVKVEFVAASSAVRLRSAERRPAVFSYFRGPKESWKTGLPSFGQIVYEDVWPGIDLIYRAEVGALKYEFRVQPEADPGKIQLRYLGAASLLRTADGALRVETPVAAFEDTRPIAWQCNDDGTRNSVDVAYAVQRAPTADEATVGFHLGKHATDRELVIDPAVFVYCGYLGGTGPDGCTAIAVDAAGNAYLGGGTGSDQPSFPVRVGPGMNWAGGNQDGFVAKVDASGRHLIYCGYIGGVAHDNLADIAVDSTGSAYVVGWTGSTEATFPVTIGPDLTFNGRLPSASCADCFVAKVNPAGTGLDYCGYIGGMNMDYGFGIDVDACGCAYVAGATNSPDASMTQNGIPFPTKVGPDLTYNATDMGDAFVAKVDATGKSLIYCGYIGGDNGEYARDVAVDSQGRAYVCGFTQSAENSFPVKVGPVLKLSQSIGNYQDAFVARVNAAGTGLDYCGYIGGLHRDDAYGIAVDGAFHAYVVGWTLSAPNTMPLKVGPFLTSASPGLEECFVAKVTPSGGGFVYCGLLGSDGIDIALRVAADARGHAYVVGNVGGDPKTFPFKDWPIAQAGIPRVNWGHGFVTKVDTTGQYLHYSGLMGGAGACAVTAVSVTPSGTAFVSGGTQSDEKSFPVKVGPDLTFNGGGDAFVAAIKYTNLAARGAPRLGGTVSLSLSASDSAGLPYQVGTSLGSGPMQIDRRQIGLSPDALLTVSIHDLWPWILVGYRGTIGTDGAAQAKIVIPMIALLVGVRLHTAFVTLDPTAPSGIRDISDTVMFTITT